MGVRLQVVSGPHAGKKFEFAEHDTFLVGRASYAHFRLPKKDPYFSRAHFIIEVNPPRCRLVDLSSSNGTFVNDRRVQETDLVHGDLIRGGDTVLQVSLCDEADTTWQRPLGKKEEAEGRIPSESPREEKGDPVAPDVVMLAEAKEQPTLTKYRLIRELGRGGMGIIHLAAARDSGRLFAIKTISPHGAVSPREVQRFIREASILRQLVHPNIVRFHEFGEFDDGVFLAMEYVQGSNAQQMVQRAGPLAIKPAVNVTIRLLMALDYAHAKNFVHRDIKPANLLIGRDANGIQVKLSDFGIARVYQTSKLSGLTMQGDIGGSVGYMAPEQITHYRSASPLSDLFSTTATLYFLLTGKLIYDFPPNIAGRVRMILQDRIVPIGRRREGLPSTLVGVIDRGLQRDPQHRFPSAASMIEALRPFGK
jgi:serine/threonine-protein kinase